MINNQYLSTKTSRYNVLEIAPINKLIGTSGYSPIEKILLGLSEELPKLKGKRISTYTLCAKGSKVHNTIETVEPIGDWHEIPSDLNKESYAKHFEKIKTIENFDIIHNHTAEFIDFIANKKITKPVVNTVHISHNNPDISHYYLQKEGSFYVAISQAHKKDLERKGIKVERVIYNGIKIDEIPYETEKEDYVLCIGRITPDKGQDRAIDIAKKAGCKIVIVGPVQKKIEDTEYFEQKIKPHIEMEIDFERDPCEGMRAIINSDKKVIYCSEVGDSKYVLYKKAKALLFPIQWEEPFGLVMIEALATGTPVLAYNKGSVPEIIEEGRSGFIFDNDITAYANGIKLADTIDPSNCRRRAMDFSVEMMARNYADFFEEIIG